MSERTVQLLVLTSVVAVGQEKTGCQSKFLTDSPRPCRRVKVLQPLFRVLAETSFVGDDRPGFFFSEHAALYEGRHTSAGTSIFHNP